MSYPHPTAYRIFFSSRTLPNNQMWCPDCVAVESAVKSTFSLTDPSETSEKSPSSNHSNRPQAELIYVGSKEEWRVKDSNGNWDNVWRKEPYNVPGVPSILKLNREGKVVGLIQDNDILDQQLMGKFLAK